MPRSLLRKIFLSVFVLALLSGCPPPGRLPVTRASLFPVGARAQVGQPAALLSRQPVDEGRLDPRRRFRGEPGWVLAPGAYVRRVSGEDPRVAQSAQVGKVDPVNHPWIFVEVVESPLAAQEGSAGWVHADDLLQPGEAYPQKLELRDDLLQGEAWLCAQPVRSPEPGKLCGIKLHPSLRLRFLGCEEGFAQVELWDPDGKYVAGFVRPEAFVSSPCP
jgi:hypothetical protein